MRKVLFLWLFCLIPAAAQTVEDYRPTVEKILTAAQQDDSGYRRLVELCDSFGPRLSGSQALERALDWALMKMREDGLDKVTSEPVEVPVWVRGDEQLFLLEPYEKELQVLGLGGSVGTGPAGVSGEVMVVTSFKDLDARGAQARDKIVLFDVPFTRYGETVAFRIDGASRAARHGARAALLRSVTPYSLATPHTGMMDYEEGTARIPFAAITPEDAATMHRQVRAGQRVSVRLHMDAQTLPDATSRNVMGELRGREKPHEIIVIGGHIDSWDVGQGAQDDGGGCLIAWEALRLLKRLGLRPRRTIRVVLWTNEENGARGAKVYAENRKEQVADHVLAIESDSGIFTPKGFSYSGNPRAEKILRQVVKLFEPIGADGFRSPGGGVDIAPLMRQGVPGLGLSVEGSKYFYYHHSESDTIDKVSLSEFQLCTGVVAAMSYIIADLPQRLPFGLE